MAIQIYIALIAALMLQLLTAQPQTGLLTGTSALPTAQPLAGQQYAYTYDNLGNVTQKQTGGDAGGANLRTQTSPANTLNQYATYQTPSSFDVIGQAPAGSTVTVNGTAATFQDTFFRANVDTANTGANGIWQSVSISDGTTTTTTGNLYVPPASFTPTYDLDGNLTDDGEWTYLWDAENRMKTTTRAARAVAAGAPYRRFEHIYDAMSRLVQTQTLDSAAATIPLKTEQYIYNGWNRVAMLESTGSATPALRQSYVWGLDISALNGHSGQDSGGVGALLCVNQVSGGLVSESHCPCYDSNGNITAMVNAATGAISAQYEYSPFGETTRATGPFAEANPYRFSTKPTNSETGLIYYGYRFYKPKWQTWPSRDPIEEDGGENLYGFVGNNSIRSVDKYGLENFTISGNVRLDNDGSGSNHGQRRGRSIDTSLHRNGHPMNADTMSFVVVSFRNRCEHGIRPGDAADVVVRNQTLHTVVGDVGPNGVRNYGEISVHTADELHVDHHDDHNHPANGAVTGAEVAVTITYHGSARNGTYTPGPTDNAPGTCVCNN